MSQLGLSDVSPLLTERAICTAFQRRTGSDKPVRHVQVSRAAAPGEGLIGAVYRITVSSDTHRASFVAKGTIRDPLLRKTLDCATLFQRETYFYENILPTMVEIQKSTGAKERVQNCIPIFYGAICDGINDYILMEDLAESGCAGVEMRVCFSYLQLTSALRTMAHFHAVSLALRTLNPNEMSRIMTALNIEVYYSEEKEDWYRPYQKSASVVNLEALAAHESPDTSHYWEKFNTLISENMYQQVLTLCRVKTERSVVLNGDAWTSNFMFSSERVVLIDFQLARVAPLAFDLTYLIFACCDHSFTKQNFETAIDEYYDAFGYYLRDMKLDVDVVYPRAIFDEDLRKWGKFGLLTCLTTIPLAAGEQRHDNISNQPLSVRFPGCTRIPLEILWPLQSYKEERHRLRLVNVIRIAVDSGII